MGVRGPHARPFWSLVAFGRDCWEWTGRTAPSNGYGLFWDGTQAKTVSAHRHAYQLTVGDIPEGQVVMHACDNRRCVRPDHLSVGTTAENNADMVAKGRSLRGEANPNAKLTADQAREIRRMLASRYTKAEIARRMKVSEAAIYSIARGRSWAWVGEAI